MRQRQVLLLLASIRVICEVCGEDFQGQFFRV